MRWTIPLLILAAACAPQVPVPDQSLEARIARGEGVGFGNYQEYQEAQAALRAQREAALQGAPSQPAVLPAPIVEPAPGTPGAAGLDPSIAAAVDALQPAGTTPSIASPTGVITPPAPAAGLDPVAPVGAAPLGPITLTSGQGSGDAPGGDAAPAATPPSQPAFASDQATVVAPSSGAGSTLGDYALSTTNAVGQPVHERSGTLAISRHERNCARYGSDDRAQEAFLVNGGPVRDREGLDPDGDGFACGWSPVPYRTAAGR